MTADNVKEIVHEVAVVVQDRCEFKRRAEVAAQTLGSESIPILKTLYHGESCPPKEYEEQFNGLGDWLSAKQFAVFEIYYFLGSAALTELKEVAFGDYDWTQGNAIEILCRLAANGCQRKEIVSELKQNLPNMREEAHFYAIGPLLSIKSELPDIEGIISELRQVPEFDSSYSCMLTLEQYREAKPAPKKQKSWWKFW